VPPEITTDTPAQPVHQHVRHPGIPLVCCLNANCEMVLLPRYCMFEVTLATRIPAIEPFRLVRAPIVPCFCGSPMFSIGSKA
jgi:hypothetical protein